MKKIELTEREIEVIHDQLEGRVEEWASEEVRKVLGRVLDRAIELMHEEEAYEAVNGNLVLWYWNKYLAQQEESK